MGGKTLPVERQELPETGQSVGARISPRPEKITIFQVLGNPPCLARNWQ
jgi:hypothetical protein